MSEKNNDKNYEVSDLNKSDVIDKWVLVYNIHIIITSQLCCVVKINQVEQSAHLCLFQLDLLNELATLTRFNNNNNDHLLIE